MRHVLKHAFCVSFVSSRAPTPVIVPRPVWRAKKRRVPVALFFLAPLPVAQEQLTITPWIILHNFNTLL